MEKNENRKGVTMIEMVVAATIMIITSMMVIGFTQSGGSRLKLTTEQAKVAGVLNRTKSLALQKYKTTGIATSTCGFAFTFNNPVDTYSISPVIKNPLTGICDSVQTAIENFSLTNKTTFVVPTAQIIFESPYLTVKNPMVIVIGLSNDDADQTAGIEVTGGGAIILQ